MKHNPFVFTTAAVFGVCCAAAMADLPGTLNFDNVTATRVVQNVAEGSFMEKDCDFGDYDNDGDLDFLVAAGSSDFGERKNKLYRNDGGVFTEVSGAPVIPEFSQSDVSRNAFFRDYNRDGWLDIYVINDSNSGGFAGQDQIYYNVQVGGVFSHFSRDSNNLPNSGQYGASCGGVSEDFDEDNIPDVYSGNYPGPSQDVMLDNSGGASASSFSIVTSSRVPNDGDYTVDVAAGDMNGDGHVDLLISNWSNNYIYYNNPSDVGNYKTGQIQNLGSGGASENSMEPADFDNDGKMDFYWSNGVGSTGDRVYQNTGNNGAGVAQYSVLNNLPPLVNAQVSRKATVADLNDDGRTDIFVMFEAGNRPVVLRNTTVGGDITFVDWTPGDAFPANGDLAGWAANAFDTNGDGDLDIFLGAFDDDHLFENVDSNEVAEDDLKGGVLPELFNSDPVAVDGSGSTGESDTYTINGLGTNAFVSVVLNGPDDYTLEILSSSDSVLATVDRGGLGVEEAIQFDPAGSPSTLKVRVTIDEGGASVAADIAGDGTTGPDGTVDTFDLLFMLSEWGEAGSDADIAGDGSSNPDGTVDTFDLLALLADWGAEGANSYVLEVMARNN